MLRPGDWCASGPSTPLSPHYNSTSVGDRKHVLLNKYALRLCPSAPHHSKLVTLGGRWQLAGPGPELLRCGCGTRCLLGSLLLRVCDAWVTWRCRWMELEPERHGAPTTRPHGAAMHLSYVHRVRNVQVRACSRHSRQAPRPGHRCIHVASSHHGSTAAEHSCTGRERKRGTGRLYAAPCRFYGRHMPQLPLLMQSIHPSNTTGETVSVVPRERQHSWSWSCSCSAATTHHHCQLPSTRVHFPGSSSAGTVPRPTPRARNRHKRNQAGGQGERHRDSDSRVALALACIESGGSALRARSVLGAVAVAVAKAGPRLFSLSPSVVPLSRVKLTGAGSKPHLSPQQ